MLATLRREGTREARRLRRGGTASAAPRSQSGKQRAERRGGSLAPRRRRAERTLLASPSLPPPHNRAGSIGSNLCIDGRLDIRILSAGVDAARSESSSKSIRPKRSANAYSARSITLGTSSSITVVSASVESAAAESARGESIGRARRRVSAEDGEDASGARRSGVVKTESEAQLRDSEFWRSVSSTLRFEVRRLVRGLSSSIARKSSALRSKGPTPRLRELSRLKEGRCDEKAAS